MSESGSFKAKFNDKEYHFFVMLENTENDKYFILNRSMVRYLEIEDNIFNPFNNGVMVINNELNFMEKSDSPYEFLGNGRDLVTINIFPITNGEENDLADENIQEHLAIKHKFFVTECVDVVYQGYVCKRVAFVEWAQHILAESIFNLFGVNQPKTPNSYLDTNAGNAMETGDLLKKILEAAYKTSEIIDNSQFDTDGSSEVNLTPYGVMTYMDVLNYVMSFHAYQKSPTYLSYDAYHQKFKLTAYSTIFKKHNEEVLETLIFSAQSDKKTKAGNNKRTFKYAFSEVHFEDSKIMEYFLDSASSKHTVDLLRNSSVLSSSSGFKTMIFNTLTLNSESFIEDFKNLFIEPFKNLFSNYTLEPNFDLNPNKDNNYDSHKGGLPPILDEKRFLNQKLMTLLFMNDVYKFTLKGMSHRKCAKFIDVVAGLNESDGMEPNDWELNTYGRHFIVNIKHIFSDGVYMNDIETIKPYKVAKEGADSEGSLSNLLKS
jgi:hypothetical protein